MSINRAPTPVRSEEYLGVPDAGFLKMRMQQQQQNTLELHIQNGKRQPALGRQPRTKCSSRGSSSSSCLGTPGRAVRQWALRSASCISQPHSQSEAERELLNAHCKYHLSHCLPRCGLPPRKGSILYYLCRMHPT